MGSARTLAQVYRRFAEAEPRRPVTAVQAVALALSESDEALRAIETAPPRKRNPDRDPGRAARPRPRRTRPGASRRLRHSRADADDAATLPPRAAIDTLLRMTDAVAAIAVRRPVRADETGRHAVLYPAIAEAARRAAAKPSG